MTVQPPPHNAQNSSIPPYPSGHNDLTPHHHVTPQKVGPSFTSKLAIASIIVGCIGLFVGLMPIFGPAAIFIGGLGAILAFSGPGSGSGRDRTAGILTGFAAMVVGAINLGLTILAVHQISEQLP